MVLENLIVSGYLKLKEVKEIMKVFYKIWDDKFYKKFCDFFEID